MDRVEERSLNPGKEMRESELLFQVILTQVACTKDSRGEAGGREGSEGVKVHRHRLLWRATYGGGRGAAWQCVCVCGEHEREGNLLTCQVGNQVRRCGSSQGRLW